MEKIFLMLFTFLIIVPFIAYRMARKRSPRHIFTITGVSTGIVIAPCAFGLYSWFFVSWIGLIPGYLGLILVAIHEPPGFHLAMQMGLVPAGSVVTSIGQRLVIESLNAIVWGVVYGIVGYLIDRARNSPKKI